MTYVIQIACAAAPPEVPDSLSPPLRDLTLRCLELDPAQRPSARELLLHPALNQVRQSLSRKKSGFLAINNEILIFGKNYFSG